MRRAFHTLKGSGRVVGARRIGDFAWSVENLLNRVIDGTLERSSGMLATLREAIAIAAGAGRRAGRPVGRGRGTRGTRRAPRRADRGTAGGRPPARPAAATPESTLVLQKLDEEIATKRLATLPEPPSAPPPAPAPVESTPPADDAWLGRPAAYAEGGDSSLQEIYQKEVQSHLEVIRAYLRHAWLAVGTHTVTEDLYRACHTLRGASRTAGIRHSIRLAEPLHRWLRRMFDHDAPFDEAGLAVLADSVVGFEDVLAAVHEDTGRFTNLDRLVKRIEQQDAALERRLAEEPPQMAVSQEIAPEAPPEPPPAEPAAPAAPPAPVARNPAARPWRGSRSGTRRARRAAEDSRAGRDGGQAALPGIGRDAAAGATPAPPAGAARPAAKTMTRKSPPSSAKRRRSCSSPPTRRSARSARSAAAVSASPSCSGCCTR